MCIYIHTHTHTHTLLNVLPRNNMVWESLFLSCAGTELVRFMRDRVGGILDEIIFVLDNIMVMWRKLRKNFIFLLK